MIVLYRLDHQNIFKYLFISSIFTYINLFMDTLSFFFSFFFFITKHNCLQLHVALGILVLFLHLQHSCRPFHTTAHAKAAASARTSAASTSASTSESETEENNEADLEAVSTSRMLHKNEIASLVVLASTVWCAAFFSFCDDTTSGVCDLMSVVTVTTNIFFLLFNIIIFFCFFVKRNHLDEKFQKMSTKLKGKRLTTWVNKLSGRASRNEAMVQEEVEVGNGGGGGGGGSGSGSGGGEQKTVSKLNPYFSVVEMSSVNIKNNKNKKNCADDELPTVMPFG